MHCNCCKAEIPLGKAKCPVCGFPTLIVGSADGSESVNIEERAAGHRKNKLKNISILLKTYCYTLSSDSMELNDSRYIKIADAAALEFNTIKWLGSSFESLESDRAVTLDIIVQNGEEQKNISLNAVPQRVISHSSIGIMLDDGFTARMAIGTTENYIFTDAIALI